MYVQYVCIYVHSSHQTTTPSLYVWYVSTDDDLYFYVHYRFLSKFWSIVDVCNTKGDKLIRQSNFVPESVRLFGLGMDSPVDILQVITGHTYSTFIHL